MGRWHKGRFRGPRRWTNALASQRCKQTSITSANCFALVVRLGVGALCLLAGPLAAAGPAIHYDIPHPPARDSLMEALACRTDLTDMPGLLERLREERPADFTQTQRQYSQPMMDSYRLRDTVSAWGSHGDTVVITDDRVLLAIDGSMQNVTAELERHLQQSADTPLAAALDEQHALVVYQSDQPGLQDLVLVGCEYRLPGLSLLQSAYPDLTPPSESAANVATRITP